MKTDYWMVSGISCNAPLRSQLCQKASVWILEKASSTCPLRFMAGSGVFTISCFFPTLLPPSNSHHQTLFSYPFECATFFLV